MSPPVGHANQSKYLRMLNELGPRPVRPGLLPDAAGDASALTRTRSTMRISRPLTSPNLRAAPASRSIVAVATLLATAIGAAIPAAAYAQDTGNLDSAAAAKAFPPKPPYSPYAGRNYPTRPLFGDTHLH